MLREKLSATQSFWYERRFQSSPFDNCNHNFKDDTDANWNVWSCSIWIWFLSPFALKYSCSPSCWDQWWLGLPRTMRLYKSSNWILLQGYNSNSLFLFFNGTGPNFMHILWVISKMQVWIKSPTRRMGNHDPYLLVGPVLRSSFSYLFPNSILPYGSTINCCWLVNTPTILAEDKSHHTSWNS